MYLCWMNTLLDRYSAFKAYLSKLNLKVSLLAQMNICTHAVSQEPSLLAYKVVNSIPLAPIEKVQHNLRIESSPVCT